MGATTASKGEAEEGGVEEEAGELFRDMALGMSCSVGLSVIVSVTLVPTLGVRVLGADGVVIDLGRKQRLFTGSTQLAVQLVS